MFLTVLPSPLAWAVCDHHILSYFFIIFFDSSTDRCHHFLEVTVRCLSGVSQQWFSSFLFWLVYRLTKTSNGSFVSVFLRFSFFNYCAPGRKFGIEVCGLLNCSFSIIDCGIPSYFNSNNFWYGDLMFDTRERLTSLTNTILVELIFSDVETKISGLASLTVFEAASDIWFTPIFLLNKSIFVIIEGTEKKFWNFVIVVIETLKKF